MQRPHAKKDSPRGGAGPGPGAAGERAGPAAGAAELELAWRALSNGTRRRMLDLLKAGPLTTGGLAEHFPELSRFAVMQHLRVLEEGGLVVPVREGRSRYNYLNPVPIQQIYDRWVSDYMQPWTDALTSLKHDLERLEDAEERRA